MKHLLKKLTFLALALTMSIGAWAQQEVLLTTVTATGQTSYSQSPDGIVTVTLNNIYSYDVTDGWLYSGTVTVQANQGYTITRCVFRQGTNNELADDLAPFTATIENDFQTYVSVETSTGQVNRNGMDGITSIEVYGYAVDPTVPALDETTGNWTFTMPAYNAALNITYKQSPALAWTLGGSAIPNDTTITAYYGFHQETMQNVSFSMGNDFLTYVTGLSSAEQTALFSLLVDSSSNPSVVAIGLQGPEVVGPGECDIYSIFRGNDDYLADTAYFHLNILNPDTLTLASNDTDKGTVSALLGGDAVWNNETWANMSSSSMEHSFTVGDITLSHTGSNSQGFVRSGSSGEPLFFFVQAGTGSDLTFTSNGAPFTRIDMLMVNEYSFNGSWGNPNIQPLDGWTFDGHHAVWEGNAQSVTMTSCTTSVDQITFTRGIDSIVVLDETAGTYLVIPGTEVQVVATATDGNYVSAWSNSAAVTNRLSDTIALTVSESQTLTATFAQNPLLTLATNGQGTVSLDGVTYDTVYNITFEDMPFHEGSRSFTIPASRMPYDTTFSYNDYVQAAFVSEPSGKLSKIAQGEHAVTIRISGAFEGTYMYRCAFDVTDETDDWFISCGASTVPVYPDGITKTGDNTYRVLPGTQLKVIATPDSAHYFVNWNEETALNSNTAVEKTLTMGTDDATLTANFEHKPTLTVVCNGNEKGTMELTEVPQETLLTTINSTSPNNTFTSGSRTFDNIATITFSGNVENDNNNWGWWSYSGNLTMTVSAAEGYTITRVRFFCKEGSAMDSQAPFQAILKGGNGYGPNTRMIVGNLSGHNGVTKIEVYGYCNSCPATHLVNVTDSTYLVDYGTEVIATATAKDGYHMDSWSNGAAVTDLLVNNNTVTVTTDSTIRANFIANPLLTLAADGQGSVSLDGYTPDETTYDITIEGGNTVTNVTFPYQTTVSLHNQLMQVSGANPVIINSYQSYGSANATITISEPFDGSRTISYYYDSIGVAKKGSKTITCTTNHSDAVYPDGVTAGTTANTFRVLPGTELTVNATPAANHYFVNWNEEAALNSNSAVSRSLTMPAENTTLTANFEHKPTLTLAHNDGGEMEVMPAGGVTAEDVTSSLISSWASANETMYGEDLQPFGFVAVDSNTARTWTGAPASGDAYLIYNFDGINAIYEFFSNGQPMMSISVNINKSQLYGWVSDFNFYFTTGTPNNVTASTEPNTYYIDYNTSVTVKATPSNTAYLVRFDNDADTNSNVAVEKTYGPLTAALTTAEATFAPKPVLTLAVNDTTWGSVTLGGAGSSSGSGSGEPVDVTIGDSTLASTSSYIPTYSLYEKSYTQQIYTASEIGTAGTIQSLTMWLKNNSSYTRNIEIYMKEIEDSIFANNTSWVSLSDGDLVATGTIVNGVEVPTATTYTLDTPFEYSGNGNLLFCIRDVSGQWSSGVAGTVTAAVGNQAMYAYRDETSYDISNPGVNGTLLQQKNVVKFHIDAAAGSGMPAGVAQLTDTTYRVDYGTEVTVNAEAAALHHVQGWQDQNAAQMATATYSDYFITTPQNLFPTKSQLTFQMTADTTATAMFGINSYDLTASVAESDDVRGTVSFDYTDVEGNTQAIGDTNAMTVTAQGGSQTTVTATAMTGYHFTKWTNQSGDSVSNVNPLQVTEAGSYTAVFDTNVYTLTVALCDECTNDMGTVSGSTATAKHFLSYPISVTPNIAYFFTEWSDGETEASRMVSLTSDSTIKATLLPKKVLTFAHNEGGEMEFVIPQSSTAFEGIATTSLSQNGISVSAGQADSDGMYLGSGSSITISIDGDASIRQVDFHVTNGTNLVGTINATYTTAGTPSATMNASTTYTQNNEYGSIMGVNAASLVISSSTTSDLQIDQLTVHYGSELPAGVSYSSVDTVFYVMPDSTVVVRAVPDDGHYLVSWSDNATVIDTLSVSLTMTQNETLTATFATTPVITLAVSDETMGSAYFTGYSGNTVTRAGIIKAESIDLPYQWYEASEIMSIEGGNGMVVKDQTSHYLTVNGIFDGTATVITSTGAINVTCEPTLPNGVHYNVATGNYTVMPYTEVSLTATVADEQSYYFVDWAKVTSADSTLIATQAVTTVTIDGDMKLQANFLHNPYRLTLAALPDSMGIVNEISRLPYTLSDTVIKQDWEDGMNGWTMNHCHGTTGNYSGYTTHSGNNIFLFYYTTDYPQYLISPELDISDGGTISFWYQAYSSNYTESFQVGYSTTTNDPSAFTFGEEVSTNQTSYRYYENTFPAGTKYLCISCNSNDQYYLFLDDLTITNNTIVAGNKAVVPDTTTPNTYLVMADSTVTIVANANTGYHITGWSNNAEVNSLTSDTIQVTMVSDSTISASFGNNPVVTLAANGNGTVAAVALPDFAIDNQDGTYSVLPGTAFTFVAKPDNHYYMTRWDDIDSMVNSNTAVSRTETIDGDTAFSATFAHKPVLTLAANDTAFGNVTIDGISRVDNMFDNLVDVIAASSGSQYGVATDGQYIYTSSWTTSIDDGYIFHQYDQAGNLIDNFNIDGVDLCRDMTSDGLYIYGANGETVYVMDFAAHTLVNTIQFSGAGTVRHISYDPVRDAFWVGNWNSLMLYSRTGNFIQNGPGVSVVSGTTFYQDDEDHLILLCQPNSNAVVYDYNINQDTITQLIDITSAVGVDGISGGSFIGSVNGTLYWLGDIQRSPNTISVYALGKGGVYALNDTTFIVDYNNDVTMRAAAETGYEFLNWEGANGENLGTADSLTVTMTMDTLVHAIFDTLHYNLVVNVAEASTGFGTATGSVAEARHFENYDIEATANEGYHFVVWSDGDTNASRTVTLVSDSTFTASFDTNSYHLEVVVADTCTGRGTVTGDTIAKHFLSYDIAATANPGYHFVQWSDGDTAATRTVSLVSDSTIAAIFDYNPSLTVNFNSLKGNVELVVNNQIATFTGITTTSLSQGDVTVTGQSADEYGISLKDGQTLTISAAEGVNINQVAFHLTNGTNKANLITATAGTVNATNGNAYGAVTDVHAGSVTISSTSDKSINIDQLTIQYAPILPTGVVHLAESPANVYHVVPGTVVNLLAVPADSNYLYSWEGDTTSTNDLTAVVTVAESDLTVTANFAGNPVLALTANGNGRVYFEGYTGYTVNRNETVQATNLTDFPYMWYEAGTISAIEGGNGMVYADQTNHYVNVNGPFNGSATVVTTSGSFTVTCIPTVPNGIAILTGSTYSVVPGTVITVVAEPEAEHYLLGWNDIATADTLRTVTITTDTNLVANFLHFPYTLTVNVNEVMGSAVADSAAFVTLNQDGTYTVMADSTVTLIATADSGYHFVNWTDANNNAVSTDATFDVTMVSDTAITANIDTNVYKLIVLAADTNMGAVAGTDTTAKHFLTYDISATPNPGFRFMGWSDGDTNASRTISLVSDTTLTATFDTIRAMLAWSDTAFTGYTLIDFNSYKPTLSNPYNVEVRYGVVEDTITVNDTTGMIGDPVAYGNVAYKTGTYHIYAVHDLTNEFFYDSVAYTLTVEQGVAVNIAKNITDGGTALFADRDSLPTLTHHYFSNGMMAIVAHGTTVDVVAEAAEGYHFTAWQEGDLVNGYNDIATTAEYTYTVPNATAAGLKAVFDTNVYNMNIAVADANDGMGTVTGPATVKHFLSGTFIATAETGYHFTGWQNQAGAVVSTLDTLVVEPVSDTTLYATFDTNTYTLTVAIADGQSNWGTVAGSTTVKHFLPYEISATAATCYEFVAWDDEDSNAVRTVTLTSDSTITASFAYTSRTSDTTLVVCDTLEWNNNTYTVSNDYNVTLQTAEGCDSTANLHLTVKKSTISVLDTTVCEQFTWNAIDYFRTTTAFYYDTNAAGCDSTAQLNLTVNHSSESVETVVTCDSTYDWNGFHYTTSTLGIYHTTNQYGCDSTATLNLTLNNAFTGIDEQQACESFTWVDGITYTESTNTPTFVYQMDNGCDSTVTLNLTISNNLTSTDVQTACESFTWIDGETYTESTNTPTYVYHLGTGCDSTVTLDLTVNNSVEHSFDGATCTYYVWDGTYYDQSGSYSKHYTAANGCDSVATLNLTVSSSLAIAISESACGSYTWNGTTYTASGAYNQTFQSVDGCDSVVTLTLTINQPTTATVSVTAGSSYTWNGQTYTESGNYTYTTEGSNGCDSTTTLQLTINNAVNGVETMVACNSYTWNGTEYTESGIYTYSHLDNYGNTQVDTLNLTINNSVEYSFSDAACNYYIWDGSYYNQSGTYSKHYTAANGCDSVATLTLTINQPVTAAISESACGSYTWNGTTYTNTGVYNYTTTGSNGCDSTVTLTLTVNQPTTATVTVNAGSSYTWNGQTYTESGSYTYTTTNSVGCDSVVTLQLTINNAVNGVETMVACGSYTWNGTEYTESGIYTYSHLDNYGNTQVDTLNLTINQSVETSFSDAACNYYIWDGTFYNVSGTYSKHYTAANGCDSVATLTLTINQPVTAAISESACGSYTWNGTTYTNSGVYNFTTTGSNGCDSTVTLTLTVNQPTTATVVASACDSYEWNGTTYTQSGSYTYTTEGSNGCDSVTTLQLTVAHTGNQVDNVTACDSYTWIDGVTYTASTNTPTFTVTGEGCNTVVTLNLTINQSVENSVSETVCGSYTWNGATYTASGDYTQTFTAANNCDSTVTLTLTVNQPVTANVSETACGSYTWNGTTYATTGVYSYTTTAANNCDSTVTLTLTVNQPTTATVTATACDSYEWNGQTYTATGNYTYTTENSVGCDSVATLQLTINHATTGIETVTACDSYEWHGTVYTASTTAGEAPAYHTLNSVGCDSLTTLNLTINNSVETSFADAACNYYIWDGSYYNQSGDYTKRYTAANGCDSVVTLTLTVNQPVTANVSETACGSYTWNGVTYAASGAYSRTLTGSNGCDSTVTLTLTVNQPTSATVVASACDSYTWTDGNGQTYTQSGNYTYTTEGSNGCDSVVTLQLTVLTTGTSVDNVTACDSYTWIDGVTYTESTNTPTHTVAEGACNTIVTLNLTINSSATTAVSETACDSYTWDGTYYNQSGNYTKVYTAANGCDSTVTLTLTVNSSSAAVETATACDSYTWNGTTYTASGVYTYTTNNSVGCDSVATLQLTVNNSATATETATACDSYTWNGTSYTTGGVYTYTTTGANGCDLTTTLNLTVNSSATNAISAEACNYYIWNGTYYTESGDYTKHFTAANGCDSTVTLTLTVNQPVTAAISETACGSYTWNGVTYAASGAYSRTFTGSNGCDSTVTLTLTVKQPTTATVSASACDSYTWNGVTYTTSGSYTYTTTGSNGCDSTVTLYLTVNSSSTAVETVTACDSYTWHGTTYTASTNTPTYTTTGANGCDLTTTLNLTVNSSATSAISAEACNYYIWGGTYYTESGDYTKHFNAANGCDSAVTLTLTVNQPVSSTVSESACGSYTWNGVTYAASGVYSRTFTGSNGCDSTVILTLTVMQPTMTTVTASACDSYTWNGTTYTASGSYTYTTTGSNGCDSTVTLYLTVNNSTTAVETVTACDSYTWHGTTYTASTNTPTYTTTGANGCNLTTTLNLTINNSVSYSFTDAACNSYVWDGTYYTTSGTYSKHYVAANGCDSTATLTLTVNQPVTATISATACGSYTWNGVTYTASGAYTQNFTGSNGCDSIVTLTLTVNQPATATVVATACDSYTWNGTTYTTSGNYTYTTTGANNCDSVTTLLLTVNHATSGVETVTACDSYTWHGTTYTASNNTDTYTTTNSVGCDSLTTLNLTINYSTTGTETEVACESYEWNGQTYTQSGIYTFNTLNSVGCDSLATLNLTVNYSTYSVLHLQGEGTIVWNGETFTESGVYERTLTNEAGCDSVVTLVLAILPEGIPTPYLYNLMDVMLTINHNQEGLENVHYVWYRWYRDGELVLEGPDKDSYSEGGSRLNGCYYLEVATDESMEYWVRSNEVCIGSVGIEEAEELEITMAPNPVLRGRTVTLAVEAGNADFQGSEIHVYDAQGRTVISLKDTYRFEANLSTGMYMVRLTLNDGRSIVKRLIVK